MRRCVNSTKRAAAFVKRWPLQRRQENDGLTQKLTRIAGEIELRSPECNSADVQGYFERTRRASLARNRLAPWNFAPRQALRGSGAIRGAAWKREIYSVASTTGSPRASTRLT